jgi:transposase
MATYSMDLRRRVLADGDAGVKTKPVAEKYGVSRTWVRSLKQKRRETGQFAPGKPTGRPRKIDRARLAALVREDADATLAELRERLGVECSITAIWMTLDALRITFKKKRSGPPSRTVPTSPSAEPSGGQSRWGLIRKSSSLSTKPGRKQT